MVLAGCLTARERSAIDAWLACIDSCDDARARAAAPGWRAVGRLADALEGPPQAYRDNIRHRLSASYRLIGSPGRTEAEYVDTYLSNYDAVYQTHAAVALGDIGTGSAKRRLREALESDSIEAASTGRPYYRDDVRRAIELALVQASTDSFAGVVAAAQFLDTIVVRPDSGALIDANTSVDLVGAFFGDDLLVSRWQDSLAFVAAAKPGAYVLKITGLGSQDGEQATPFNLNSLAYRPSDVDSIAVLPNLGDRSYSRLYLLLDDREPNDYFRFAPTVPPPVPVALRRLNVDPGWYIVRTAIAGLEATRGIGAEHAVPIVFGEQTGAIRGRVVNRLDLAIAAAKVEVRGTSLSVLTAGEGEYLITNVPVGSHTLRASRIGYVTKDTVVNVTSAPGPIIVIHLDSVVAPPPEIDVSVILDWQGGGQVAALWHRCGSLNPSAGPFIMGTVVDERGDPVGGATVTVAPGGYQAATGPLGHFTVTGAMADTAQLVARLGGRSGQRSVRVNTREACIALPSSVPPSSPPPLAFSNPDTVTQRMAIGSCWALQVTRCGGGGESDLVRLRVRRP
jgi:hypothetical protein